MRLKPVGGRPWVCAGDFNEIRFQFEKEGLRPQESQMELFRNWITDYELIELEGKGCKFTWESNPRDGVVTKEKLDRALANWHWRRLFPHANVLVLPPISSDHSPLIIFPRPRDSNGGQLKFEAIWEEHPQCAETVENSWGAGIGGVGAWAIKLDMNKAYDRLEWAFLEKCLLAYGFREAWVSLVMKMVTSVTYRFKGVPAQLGMGLASILNMQVPRKNNASWIWTSILQGRDFLKSEGRWMVAGGERVSICEDNWLVTGKSLAHFKNSVQGNVKELMSDLDRQWNIPKHSSLFPLEWCKQVVQTPICITAEMNYLFWPHTKQGDYSVKSGYKVLKLKEPIPSNLASSSAVSRVDLWPRVWGAKVPHKLKMFIWKICQDAVPLNFDASFDASSGMAATGAIFRDSSSLVEFASARKFQASSPIMAEAYALREDSLDLIKACRMGENIGEIHGIVLDIRAWASEFDSCGFTWVRRSGNMVAHRLAALALRNGFCPSFLSSWPVDLQAIVAREQQQASSYNLQRDLGLAQDPIT
ncbi:Ribonuclease H-like superfamily [Sesbania bispinosa]|nr:Ribonuclease H-like superfamily [Sesbania bispinosa]